MCLVIFIFFFGFRGFVGWDWYVYYPTFQKIEPLWGRVSENFETFGDTGYALYCTIVKSITSEYQIYVLISVIIDAIILHHVFKRYSPNYALSFAVFMVVSLGMEINLMRNTKSIMVFLLAIPYILDRKPWKYAIMMLIAISLHLSAILFVPLYFFAHKKISLYFFITVLIVGNIVYLLQVPLIMPILSFLGDTFGGRLGDMITVYSNSEIYSSARGISISYLERTATTLLVICYYNKLTSFNATSRLFVNLFIVYALVTLFTSEMIVVFSRVGILFVVSYWIIWPMLAECFTIRNNRRIYLCAIALCMILYVPLRSQTILYSYENYFTGMSTYDERSALFNRVSAELMQKQ
jgi:hypothetical protein